MKHPSSNTNISTFQQFIKHACPTDRAKTSFGNIRRFKPFQSIFINEDDVIFINKKTLKWYKSSKIAKRGFCTICGASIFYKLLESRNISIAAGMFHNPTKLKTCSNIFTKGKLDYYKLDSRMPKFDRNSK